MTTSELIAALQGQNPGATILFLYNDEFYDLGHVATPVSDATVLVLETEASTAPVVSSVKEATAAAAPAPVPTEEMAPKDESPGGSESSTPSA